MIQFCCEQMICPPSHIKGVSNHHWSHEIVFIHRTPMPIEKVLGIGYRSRMILLSFLVLHQICISCNNSLIFWNKFQNTDCIVIYRTHIQAHLWHTISISFHNSKILIPQFSRILVLYKQDTNSSSSTASPEIFTQMHKHQYFIPEERLTKQLILC